MHIGLLWGKSKRIILKLAPWRWHFRGANAKATYLEGINTFLAAGPIICHKRIIKGKHFTHDFREKWNYRVKFQNTLFRQNKPKNKGKCDKNYRAKFWPDKKNWPDMLACMDGFGPIKRQLYFLTYLSTYLHRNIDRLIGTTAQASINGTDTIRLYDSINAKHCYLLGGFYPILAF